MKRSETSERRIERAINSGRKEKTSKTTQSSISCKERRIPDAEGNRTTRGEKG